MDPLCGTERIRINTKNHATKRRKRAIRLDCSSEGARRGVPLFATESAPRERSAVGRNVSRAWLRGRCSEMNAQGAGGLRWHASHRSLE